MTENKKRRHEELIEEFLRWKKKRSSPTGSDRSPSPYDEQYLDEEWLDEDGVKILEEKEDPEKIIIIEEDEIDEEIRGLLGKAEEKVPEVGEKIHEELANRWNGVLDRGLNNEERSSIVKKYPPLGNMPLLKTPKLNPEVEAAINNHAVKMDRIITGKQKIVASVISCLGGLLSENIKTKNKSTIERLSDSVRLLCGMMHSENKLRRSLVLERVRRDLRTSLAVREPKEFLFGENLSEGIRTARAVTKAGQDLKAVITLRPLNHQGPSLRQIRGGHLNTTSRTPAEPRPAFRTGRHYHREPPRKPQLKNPATQQRRPQQKRR